MYSKIPMLERSSMKKYIAIILAIVIAIVIFFYSTNLDEKKVNIELKTKKEITTLIEDVFTKQNITRKELEDQIEMPISNQLFTLGKEAYIAEHPDSSSEQKYNLTAYIKKQQKYQKRIEKEFLKTFHYTVDKKERKEDTIINHIRIVTFYYGLYSSDLNMLLSWAMNKKNINSMHLERSEKLQIEVYKLKVLAMEVLDNHFETYQNKINEVVEMQMIYKNGLPNSRDEVFSLFCNVNGLTYPNADFSNSESKKKQEERLKNYQAELKDKI